MRSRLRGEAHVCIVPVCMCVFSLLLCGRCKFICDQSSCTSADFSCYWAQSLSCFFSARPGVMLETDIRASILGLFHKLLLSFFPLLSTATLL